MAEHTIISWSDPPTGIAQMQSALTPLISMGFFDKMEYTNVVYTHNLWCKLNDDTPVLKFSADFANSKMYISIFLYNSQTGTTTEKSIETYTYFLISDIYVTSHGAYLTIDRTDHHTANSTGIFISKTNNDATGLFVVGYNSTESSARLLTTQSWAVDDDPNYSGNYIFPTVYIRNQTTMMNVPTASKSDSVSYFPYIYYTLTSQIGYENNQTTPPCDVIQNGYRYLWTGYYMLRDDPPIDS